MKGEWPVDTVSDQEKIQNVIGERNGKHAGADLICTRVSVVKGGLTNGVNKSELNLMRAKCKEGEELGMT